jgi:hypothetical protein
LTLALTTQKQDQKIAALAAPTGELRVFNQSQVGCQAAIAGKSPQPLFTTQHDER